MAVIHCPNCGKENPDSLSICQFCQAPLTSGLRIGDKPTKKNTGELEPVLPDWLRDMRQQARDSAEQDAAEAASLPKIQKEEPPDLLAGLASQSKNADEEDLPGWLTGLTSKKEEKPVQPARPASDFFSQFEQSASTVKSVPEAPRPPAPGNSAAGQPPASPERDDDLSAWFTKASGEPSEPFSIEPDPSGQEQDWGFDGKAPSASSREAEPSAQEDLSWLRNLEAESKKTGELSQPRQEDHWSSVLGPPAATGSSGQEDLSWLDALGSLPASEQPGQGTPSSDDEPGWLNAFGGTPQQPTPPPAPKDDLGWLDNLGTLPAASQPAQEASRPEDDLGWLSAFAETPQNKAEPSAGKNELSWLDNLGGESQPAQAPAPEEDLSWLHELQGAPGPFSEALPDTALDQSKPAEAGEQEKAAPDEDLSWLRDLQGTPGSFPGALSNTPFDQAQPVEAAETEDIPHVSPFTPRQTAPLSDNAEPELPDWLKSATEEPSMPLGPQALDRMREDRKPLPKPDENISKALLGAMMLPKEEQPSPAAEEPTPVEPVLPTNKEAAPLFNEASSLFSDNLPDWLSNPEPEASQPQEEIGIHAEGGEALSLAELPSWVQAMRPVGAVIAAEAVTGVDNLPVEREGPLAGLRGVIPAVAIGSLRRPRPIPLTLQTSEDQQASAAILEQILLGETTPRPVASAPTVTSQQTLRWIIAGLLIFVLGAVLFSGTQIMPISPVLPPEARDMTNIVMGIADSAPVLVIMDYQPGLAGEMEAVSGPLLDQLVRLHNPYLSFVATSPNGNALVERLLANTNINQAGGAGYVSGQNYDNLGYLPGGEAGVLAFLQSPQAAMPGSRILNFSEYAAILLLTDHADSARTWVEQISILKQADPTLASQPLLAVTSAQTGPMLQPYFSSSQITGLISGLPTAASYELLNDNRPGMARSYWDAFGVGMMMAVFLIVIGSLWSVYSGIRASRVQAGEE